jgi:beta-D-xylosidase 4
VYSKAHQQLAKEASEQSLVLLQNPGGESDDKNGAITALLPLKRGLKIAIIGPSGNASDAWQAEYHGPLCPEEPENSGYYGCLPTALSEITAANHGGSTSFVSGCFGGSKHEDNPNAYKDQACGELTDMALVNSTIEAADVVVLLLGLNIGSTNQEGVDRLDYGLPGKQPDLVQAVGSLGKPVVAVVLSGGAVGVDYIRTRNDWALIIPGQSGVFGPRALARMIFGDAPPAGLLPYTIYPEAWALNPRGACEPRNSRNPHPPNRTGACMNDMGLRAGDGRTFRFYGYKNASLKATYEFGAGLYYTTFSLQAQQVQHGKQEGGSAAITTGAVVIGDELPPLASYTVTYKNTGTVASPCRVVVFACPMTVDAAAPKPLPVKSIVAFGGAPSLAPGESFSETFAVSAHALSMTDYSGKRAVYAGTYEIHFSMGSGVVHTEPLTVAKTAVLDQMPPPRTP